MGKLRNQRLSLQSGGIRWLYAQGPLLAFLRESDKELTAVVLNTGEETASLTIPWPDSLATDAISGQQFLTSNDRVSLEISPVSGMILT